MTTKAPSKQEIKHLLWIVLIVAGCTAITMAQTTSTFTYQGRLTEAGLPANGFYDLQFTLYDDSTGGGQQGNSLTLEDVQAANGVFTVQLDFGATAFTAGDARFLEIKVRGGASTDAFTTLAPRQSITSTPYATRSAKAGSADSATTAESATNAADASKLGGVDAGQYVQMNDARLSDPRPPTAGSSNYIQNQTAAAQPGGFNVSGSGKLSGTLSASAVTSATQYNIGTQRVLDVSGSNNTFVGVGAGVQNTGSRNTVVGDLAASNNISGAYNSIFGHRAGFANTTGQNNSYFGALAGEYSSGSYNVSLGLQAGFFNELGNFNTFIGTLANPSNPVLFNATAIGARAHVAQDNSLILGSIALENGATSDTFVGIGTAAPTEKLTVKTATGSYGIVHTDGTITVGSFVGGSGNGGYLGTKSNHPLHLFANDGAASLTIDTTGHVRIVNLGFAGSTQLCRNATNQISNCSSSLRYKTDLHPFTPGLDILRRLRPISFRWKESGALDVGFGAEEVAAVEPLFVTRNETGEVEGVKYDRMSVALVNAVLEQQAQIEQQNNEVKSLRTQLTNLQKLICLNAATAQACP